MQFYEKHNFLDECLRKDLSSLIVTHVFDNRLQFAPSDAVAAIKQIIRTFPTETEVCLMVSFI